MMLSRMLEGFRTHSDPRLLVGYDKSDDASVYKITDDVAIVQTTDFFPPIVDDPFLYGQIAATNALSDVYAMGGEPKLALNIMCLADSMDDKTVREILRGGYNLFGVKASGNWKGKRSTQKGRGKEGRKRPPKFANSKTNGHPPSSPAH